MEDYGTINEGGNKMKWIVIICIVLLISAIGVILYLTVYEDTINQAREEGALNLAYTQFQTRTCTFFNGTDIMSIELNS